MTEAAQGIAAGVVFAAIIIFGIAVLLLLSAIALYGRLMSLRADAGSAQKALAAAQQLPSQSRNAGIEKARQRVMDTADAFNAALDSFPANILAAWLGLERIAAAGHHAPRRNGERNNVANDAEEKGI